MWRGSPVCSLLCDGEMTDVSDGLWIAASWRAYRPALTVRSSCVRRAGEATAWMARPVLGDRIVTAMSAALPAPDAPVVSVAGAIARMEAIAAALPAADG